ncbi:hypothetical protein BS17DRAFT_788479 [Gyrodon lividus]|nr:hypothetical protein BS17DRAFT_788479 [Gyrodon lividus]
MSSQSTINPMTGTVVSPVNLSYSALVATLVLLLAVSSAIVTRSLVLRRRHQRLLEEAFRAGTWVPHRNDPRSDRRQQDIGEKPKLWEAWLQSDEEGDGGSGEKGKWDDIMPVCAAYIDQSPSALPPTSSENAIESQLHPPRFLRPFPRRPVPSLQSVTASPMAVQAPSSSSSSPIRSSSPAVHVTVLIAMPTPIQKLDRHEDGPPVVEIGVIVVGVLDDDESPSRNVS